MDKIKLNIDTQKLQAKPAQFDGRLRNRLCSAESIREVTPAQLINYIQQGRSFTPAVMTGTTGDTWKSQQVICADIDNDTGRKDQDGNKIRIDNPLTPARALEVMKQHGIEPCFMYYSFSNAPEWPKFRIVLVLDEPITDPNEAGRLAYRFAGLFNAEAAHCADTTARDNARIYYGGKPDCMICTGGGETRVSLLQALPDYQADSNETATRKPEPDRTKDSGQRPAGGDYAALQARFEYDKKHFDLAGYVQETTDSMAKRIGSKLFFNPCPVCGHNDDFQVTGSLWHCHSASGGEGGTIIDYLMHRDGLAMGDACDKFKYEIMGYNREEWRRAYIADKFPKTAREMHENLTNEAQKRPDQEGETMQKAVTEAASAAQGQGVQDTLTDFLEKIQTEAYKPYKTGLSFFDDLLGGGVMRQTLLLLMAAPSAGKTTLAQQVAETMAAGKSPVIYLNFEMSREQMLAKAISARTYRAGHGKTVTEILQGYNWTEEDRQQITAEIEKYREKTYPYIQYMEISSDLDAVLDYLKGIGDNAKAAGTPAPAVVVDYLHLLTSSKGLDVQELIKQAITGLKDYAKEYDTFVIAILAANRDSNKKGRYSMESARDSSSIEYTGDYIISLNYYQLDNGAVKPTDTDKISELQQDKWRQMILRLHKNRFGIQGKSARAYFHAPGNTFYGENDFLPADADRQPFDQMWAAQTDEPAQQGESWLSVFSTQDE